MPPADRNHPEINVTTVYLLLGELKEKVDTGFAGVNQRLDKVNGRVGTQETKLAVLEERTPGSHAGWWGAGASAAVVGVLELGKALVGLWK